MTRLNSLRKKPRRVPKGRLNLAQDAVLGRGSRTKSPVGTTGTYLDISEYSAIENSRSAENSEPCLDSFSVVPTGLFNGAC